MYRHLYGLKEKPFQISTDPAFLWMGPKHKEALAVLVYGVSNSKGFLLLTGGVGTGKTTLIRALLGQLDKKVAVAMVHDPGLTPMDFFNFIAVAYGMRERYTNKVDFLFDFEAFLRKTRTAGRTALLIVDEAQRLDQTLLEEIRLLSNIEDPDQKLLNVFFVGQEEFLEIIADPQNRALKQRITINYHLETLSREETEQLVRHRLKVAGATLEVFTPDAFPGIFTFSLGAPRLINILCDHALLTGFVHNVETIGADIIAECTQDLLLPGEHADGRPTTPPAAASEPADTPKPTADPKPTAATVTAGMMLQNAPPPSIERRRWPWVTAALLLLTIGIAFAWQRGWHLQIPPLDIARVTPSVPAVETSSENVMPPESAASPQPEASEQPTPVPVVPATTPPARPQATLPAEGRDTAEETESPSAAEVPERTADMDVRHDAGDAELTPDSLSPQPLPETAETEPLIWHEIPEPLPPEDIAARAPVDKTATGSSRESLSAAVTTAPTMIAGVGQQPPKNQSDTTTDQRNTRDIQETSDEIDTYLPSPPVSAQTETTEATADNTAPPLPAALPEAGPPATPPPAAPLTAARTEPATVSILGLPAATTATTPTAPLPYPTEDKIRDFIGAYRKAYESLDINRFRLFFTKDAIELNRPIREALPVYQRNFEALAALDYDIQLKAWKDDAVTGQVTVRGQFEIRYRMADSAWRNTQGEISMDLVEEGGVYRIKRLDYWKQ